MENVRRPIWKHSGLYFRNSLMVLGATLIVFVLAISVSFHWFSIGVLILSICCNYLLWQVYFQVHPRRTKQHIKKELEQFTLGFEHVEFLSQDGLKLSGWWIPGWKKQTMLLLHDLGTSSLAMITRASLLAKFGYSVLLMDFRAHGQSEGDTALTGGEIYDVLGAIEYLESRSDVDADQIGVWGVSLGARVALQAAGKTQVIGVLVLENLSPANIADHNLQLNSISKQVGLAMTRLKYMLCQQMSGGAPETSVVETLHLIYPRPIFFLSTGNPTEHNFTLQFFNAGRQPKYLIEISSDPRKRVALEDSPEFQQVIHQGIDQVLGKHQK